MELYVWLEKLHSEAEWKSAQIKCGGLFVVHVDSLQKMPMLFVGSLVINHLVSFGW